MYSVCVVPGLQFETHIKARLVCLRLFSNMASVPRRTLNQTNKLEILEEGKPYNSHIEIQLAKTIQACIKHDLLHIGCDVITTQKANEGRIPQQILHTVA